jgi:thiol-disulfide isomerase/thioredoxin
MLQALILSLALLAPTQDGGTPAKPASAPQADPKKDKEAEKQRELGIHYQMLTDQYARAELEWSDQMRKVAGEPEQTKILTANHPVKEYWTRFEQLGNDGSGRALLWMAGQAENEFSDKADIAQKKIALFRKVIEHNASDAWAMDIVVSISVQRAWLETSMVEELLTDFVKKTTNKEFGASALMRIMAINSGISGRDTNARKVAEIRDQILRDYGDTEVAKQLNAQSTFKPPAIPSSGPAPELKGKDVDGAEFDLAASRGKVVLLDFWGFWNPQSRSMIPHLRELATLHAADPFVILGVSTDEDAARFRELSKEQGVPWRSAWEGGRNGPIAKAYNVRTIPTLFLIDGQGNVVKSWAIPPSDKSLDDEIAAAIAAAKGAKK